MDNWIFDGSIASVAAAALALATKLQFRPSVPPTPPPDPRIDTLMEIVRETSDRIHAIGERVARIEGRLDRD